MKTLSHPPHLKLQEMCDCFLETDFPAQLTAMVSSNSTDFMEDGYKYLALALLEATTEKATELSFQKRNGFVIVLIKTRDGDLALPTPSRELAGAVMSIVRHILHIEEEKGESPLVLGLKSGQLDLYAKIKKDTQEETLKIHFPELESKKKPGREAASALEKKSDVSSIGKHGGDICPECGLTYWKCGACKFIFTAPSPPEKCPDCGEVCDFQNITCYTPDCGGPGNIDQRLV